MPVTKEMLRAMLESLGGLNMTDEELEKAVPQVQIYPTSRRSCRRLTSLRSTPVAYCTLTMARASHEHRLTHSPLHY